MLAIIFNDINDSDHDKLNIVNTEMTIENMQKALYRLVYIQKYADLRMKYLMDSYNSTGEDDSVFSNNVYVTNEKIKMVCSDNIIRLETLLYTSYTNYADGYEHLENMFIFAYAPCRDEKDDASEFHTNPAAIDIYTKKLKDKNEVEKWSPLSDYGLSRAFDQYPSAMFIKSDEENDLRPLGAGKRRIKGGMKMKVTKRKRELTEEEKEEDERTHREEMQRLKRARNSRSHDEFKEEREYHNNPMNRYEISNNLTPQNDGLTNVEIEDIVKDHFNNYKDKFAGVICSNEIMNLARQSTSTRVDEYPFNKYVDKRHFERRIFGFIMNTLLNTAGRYKMGHWVAVVIDNAFKQHDGSEGQCIMYYDSFGDPPNDKFIHDIQVLKRYKERDYQFKINTIKNQSVNSDNCGYFAVNFLNDILVKNQSFKEATNFNVTEGERRANSLRRHVEFGSI